MYMLCTITSHPTIVITVFFVLSAFFPSCHPSVSVLSLPSVLINIYCIMYNIFLEEQALLPLGRATM